jgi:hypothetical protein
MRLLIPVVLAAAALCVPAAHAGLISGLLGGNCPSKGSQVFAPWGDLAYYYLAQNGGLENGSTGWSLSGGAKVVGGNEPFLPTGTHSLSLPSGSVAYSPVVCIASSDLYVRMFANDAGGADSGLRVRVVWYGLLNQVLGISDFATYTPGGGWAPSGKLSSAGGLQVPLVPLLGSTSARVEVTPLGSGSQWQIDDLYVDPWINGAG